MSTKRKAEETENDSESKKESKGTLVKKLVTFVQEALKKHPTLTLDDVKELWTLACDGPGVTPNEFHTLQHFLSDETIRMEPDARKELHFYAIRQESGTSPYKIISGVKYDRKCLDLAEHLFKDGRIDLGDAKLLWAEVEDGPGVTEVEKRTIEKIVADKKDHMSAGAIKYFNEKLASWVNPRGGSSAPSAPTSAPSTTSSVSAPSSPPSSSVSAPAVAPPPVAVAAPAVAAPAVAAPAVASEPETKDVDMKVVDGERIELVVDCSSSMSSVLSATVKGLNDFLTQQQAETGAERRHIRLTVFGDKVKQPPKYHCALSSAPAITSAAVMPDGMTALLDGIGTAISSLPVSHKSVVVIVTDGGENSSTKFNQAKVNELIAERLAAGWTFAFLAANQDAIASGAKFGLPAGSCATFTAAVDNVIAAFQAAHGLASRSWKSVEQEQRSFTPNERFSMQNQNK